MGKKKVSDGLIPKGRTIFFNEAQHKYTDDLGNPYISATTLIGKYTEEEDFEKIAEACEKIGRNPNHPKYLRYKGKLKKQILWEWKQENLKSLEKGNDKHNYLEDAVKECSGYKRDEQGLINDQLYTIDNILSKHNFGKLKLKDFELKGIKKRYPQIYAILEEFTKKGWKIYSEIGTYDSQKLISGLIDILLVKGQSFIIFDWKTNKAPMKKECGYFEKDWRGMLQLEKFVLKDKYMKYPLNHVPDSTYYHYALQLSIYATLVETFGFKYAGSILCHIRSLERWDYDNDCIDTTEEVVEIHQMDDMRKEVKEMMEHYCSNNITRTIATLFYN